MTFIHGLIIGFGGCIALEIAILFLGNWYGFRKETQKPQTELDKRAVKFLVIFLPLFVSASFLLLLIVHLIIND